MMDVGEHCMKQVVIRSPHMLTVQSLMAVHCYLDSWQRPSLRMAEIRVKHLSKLCAVPLNHMVNPSSVSFNCVVWHLNEILVGIILATCPQLVFMW